MNSTICIPCILYSVVYDTINSTRKVIRVDTPDDINTYFVRTELYNPKLLKAFHVFGH